MIYNDDDKRYSCCINLSSYLQNHIWAPHWLNEQRKCQEIIYRHVFHHMFRERIQACVNLTMLSQYQKRLKGLPKPKKPQTSDQTNAMALYIKTDPTFH